MTTMHSKNYAVLNYAGLQMSAAIVKLKDQYGWEVSV
jgi:hypothetical protein